MISTTRSDQCLHHIYTDVTTVVSITALHYIHFNTDYDVIIHGTKPMIVTVSGNTLVMPQYF